MVRVIMNSAELLLFLVNDMLDVYMLKNGKLQAIYSRINFISLIEEIMHMFTVQAKAKGLEFIYKMSDRVPVTMVIDSRRFKQIIINLVSNALKFTNEGSIKIHCDFDHEKSLITTTVADTGIGIKKSD